MRENCMLIIAGPSGIGKTTVAYEMIAQDSRYEFVRSVTTRAKRGDRFDAEYIYMSNDEFDSLLKDGGLLEHTNYSGCCYGTPRFEVDRIFAEGKIPLLVLDINGVSTIVNTKNDLSPCGLYIYDTLDVAEQRLYDRFVGDAPTPEGLKKFVARKDENIKDYLSMPERCSAFHAFLHNNGTVADAVQSAFSIFRGFCDGTDPDSYVNSQVAAELCAMAQEKNQINGKFVK